MSSSAGEGGHPALLGTAATPFGSRQAALPEAIPRERRAWFLRRSLGTCNLSGLSDEQQAAVQFLARACSLRTAGGAGDAAAAARYAALWSLAGTAQQAGVVEQELHGRLSHAFAAAGAALGEGWRRFRCCAQRSGSPRPAACRA